MSFEAESDNERRASSRRWIAIGVFLAFASAIAGGVILFNIHREVSRELKNAVEEMSSARGLEYSSRTASPAQGIRYLLSATKGRAFCPLSTGGFALACDGGVALLSAPDASQGPEQWCLEEISSPRVIGPSRGLCPASVSCLAEAGGKIYAGLSSGGLFKIDGTGLTRILFHKDEFNSLVCMTSAGGRIAIGTRGGLLLLSNGIFRSIWEGGAVTTIALDPLSGEMAFATSDGAIQLISGNSTEVIWKGSGGVRVMEYCGGRLLWGTASGLWIRRDSGTLDRLLQEVHVRAISRVQGADRQCLVGSEDSQMWRVDLSASLPRISTESEEVLPEPGLLSLWSSGRDFFAFSTAGKLLFRRGEEKCFLSLKDLFGQESILADPMVSSLFQSDSGQLWAGFFDNGLQVLSPDLSGEEFRCCDSQIREVNRLLPGPSGSVIALTSSGAYSFQGTVLSESWRGQLKGIPCLDACRVGEGYAVATASGLCMMPGDPFSTVASDESSGRDRTVRLGRINGLPSNRVFALLGTGGRLWTGTMAGLAVISDNRVFQTLECHNSSLPAPWITLLTCLKGDIFAGTYGGGGLLIRNSGQGTFPLNTEVFGPGGLTFNPGAACLIDDIMLLGTSDRGVAMYRPDDQTSGFFDQGLVSCNVTALERLSGGSVAIGTDCGMVIVPEELFITGP